MPAQGGNLRAFFVCIENFQAQTCRAPFRVKYLCPTSHIESVRARFEQPAVELCCVSAAAAAGVLRDADVGPRDSALSRLMAFHGPGSTAPSRA